MKMDGCGELGGELKANFPPKIIIQIPTCCSMSSRIILDNITFKNNPALFQQNIQLQITFSALQPIPDLLQWKIIYVGSAKNEDYDQVLQQFQIGPIHQESTMKFTVDCPSPDYRLIPQDELICVTALILTVSYQQQEFIRVGYYVHNVLTEDFPEEERSGSSVNRLVKSIRRTILTDKPRITKFRIRWTEETMKEETNNHSPKHIYDFNQSVLGNKMGGGGNGAQEEKQSTQEEKEHSQRSIMRSEANSLSADADVKQLVQ